MKVFSMECPAAGTTHAHSLTGVVRSVEFAYGTEAGPLLALQTEEETEKPVLEAVFNILQAVLPPHAIRLDANAVLEPDGHGELKDCGRTDYTLHIFTKNR